MKTTTIYVASFLLLGMLSPLGRGQDNPRPADKPKAKIQTTPVKALIVFTEYDGDKKIKSLPYTLYVNAPDSPELLQTGWAKLRIGSRVPVYTSATSENMTYIDVGTNIDAHAAHTGDGHFLLELNLERSWVEGDVAVPKVKSDSAQPDGPASHVSKPVIRQFKSDLDVKIREGQVLESTMATDPFSGKLLKVEVSISVVK